MIAKIVKGQSFKGVVNYILDKSKQAELIDTEGVRSNTPENIISSFVAQAGMNPRLSKSVCHISLNFSAQDKDKLTNDAIVKITRDYMERMGISNTQYIVGRHHDKEHPHVHLVYNRIDNDGRTISDRNDRFRSEKICKELTTKYGLYLSPGKENVKEHRLREPDKTKYEVYNTLHDAVPQCRNWAELMRTLKRHGIESEFKYKSGRISEIEGVKFTKNGYHFNGSKVDRQFSYSKIDYQLRLNDRAQQVANTPSQHQQPPSHLQADSPALDAVGSLIGGLFDITPHSGYDENEAEFQRQQRLKKKKKRGVGMSNP